MYSIQYTKDTGRFITATPALDPWRARWTLNQHRVLIINLMEIHAGRRRRFITATPAPATADPISEPPPRSPSPTTHRPPGARHQRRPDNAIRRRPDALSKAKSRFNILLNILQSPYIAIIFLQTVFSMFTLQMIFQTLEQSY